MRTFGVIRSLQRAFALGASIPLIVLSVLAIAAEVPHFFDRCFRFASSDRTIQTVWPCRTRSGGTSETVAGTIFRLAAVQGSLLFAAVLALYGSYSNRPVFTLVGSMIVFMLTIPLSLGSWGAVTGICAICLFASCLLTCISGHITDSGQR